MMGPGYYMDPAFAGWMMFGWMVFFLGLCALIVFAIVRLARPVDPRGDPRGILDERLARGEIDATEYESRRAVLRGR